jgi:hypothetical protein
VRTSYDGCTETASAKLLRSVKVVRLLHLPKIARQG